MKKKMFKLSASLMLVLTLLLTLSASVFASSPTIRKTTYEGKGIVEVDFTRRVRYKDVKVTVKDNDLNEEQTFAIVGVDVDPFSNPPKISSSSPIGSALNGKAVGDEVEVQVPSGVRHFTVVKIEESAKED